MGAALPSVMARVAARVALVALVATLAGAAGCGESPPPADGGIDSGPGTFDAGSDASIDSGLDAGPPRPVCRGVPPICGVHATADECATVIGCAWTSCAGFPVACDEYGDARECDAAPGCTWSGAECSGTATPCGELGDETTCREQMGCAWSGAAVCRGSAVACAALDAIRCPMQPGCEPILPDAGIDAAVADGGGPRDAGARDAMSLWDGGGSCEVPPTAPLAGCDPLRGIECDGDWTDPDASGAARCSPACAATECCSPRGGAFACVPRDASGGCPAADLSIDRARIEPSLVVEEREFAADSCALLEGCVGGPGARRLLRFDAWTPNTGEADVVLGRPAPPLFEPSACHEHDHMPSFLRYELLTPDASCVVASGGSRAFCILDYARHPEGGIEGSFYDCSSQGIQVGWQNVYHRALDCQWIDVTDVPPGEYLLRVRVNADHAIAESDYADDEVDVPVLIRPTFDISAPCPTLQQDEARECGWARAGERTCEPGASVTIGCSEACGFGACTGDPMIRICDLDSLGGCSSTAALASNDDSGCPWSGAGHDTCAQVSFVCPPDGRYTAWVGPFRSDATATCELADMP